MNFINKNPKIKKLVIKGKADKAADILKKLICSQKDVDLNSIILSRVHFMQKDILKSIEVLENLLPQINLIHKEYQLEIYKMLGDYNYKIEDFKKSFLYYQLALAVKKDDKEILVQVANIYLDINNYQKAGQIYMHLSEEEPGNVYYKCMLSLYYIEIRDFANAFSILKSIAEDKAAKDSINYYTGYYHYMKKEYDKALEFFKKNCNDNSLNFKRLYYSGKTAMIGGNYEYALSYFNEAGKLIDYQNKMTLDLHYSLALCHENLNDYPSALHELKFIYRTNQEYRDIKDRIVSDKYRKAKEEMIIEFNNYSPAKFKDYCIALVKSRRMKIIRMIMQDDDILVLKVSALKDIDEKIILNKNDKAALVFIRNRGITEKSIDDIIAGIQFKAKSGIIIVAGEASPIINDHVKKRKFSLISLSCLCDICANQI